MLIKPPALPTPVLDRHPRKDTEKPASVGRERPEGRDGKGEKLVASPLATNGVLPVFLTVTCSKKGLTVGEGSERVSGRRGVVLMLVHAGDVDLENTRPHGVPAEATSCKAEERESKETFFL